MWITTCHRFTSRAEFLAACAAAGWECPPGHEPSLPHGVALDIVGPIIGPARVGEGEGDVPISGETLDPRYHVNFAWHGRDPDPVFDASLVVPATPSRGWDVALRQATQPPVPPVYQATSGTRPASAGGLAPSADTPAEPKTS